MNAPALICPVSSLPLRRVTGDLLKQINELCRKKRLKGHNGEVTKGPLSAMWIRSDGDAFYVERQMIPIVLLKESIALKDINDRELRAELIKELATWNPSLP